MLEDLDKNISLLTESVARSLGRRRLLVNTAKGLFATAASLTLGQLTNLKDAFAVTCTCNWACNSDGKNTNCAKQGGCPRTGCPSNCSICTTSSGCGTVCNYSGGYWVSCSGLCTCGGGYRLCTDCKCHNSCSCPNVCTCLSQIFCCNCCKKSDVEAEMRRIAALYASSAA